MQGERAVDARVRALGAGPGPARHCLDHPGDHLRVSHRLDHLVAQLFGGEVVRLPPRDQQPHPAQRDHEIPAPLTAQRHKKVLLAAGALLRGAPDGGVVLMDLVSACAHKAQLQPIPAVPFPRLLYKQEGLVPELPEIIFILREERAG